MARTPAGKPAARAAGQAAGSLRKGGGRPAKVVKGDAGSDRLSVDTTRFEAVMQAAEQSGLLGEKSGRIAGRVSPALVRQAKRQTGIGTDTDLIEFALATVALEDGFAEAFRESRGKVDPELDLGF